MCLFIYLSICPSICLSFLSCLDYETRRMGGIKAAGENPFFTPITTVEFWSQLQNESWNLIYQLLPKICLAFNNINPEISGSVEPFLSEFLKNLRYFIIDDKNQTFSRMLLS